MRFEKSYSLTRWTEWNLILSDSIEDFKCTYSLNPNILEANRYTYSQIDFLINIIQGEKQKLYRKDELLNQRLIPADTEEVGIIAYESDNANVDFAIDENLSDKEFLLIYDSDPDWGDDSITKNPVEDEKLVFNII